MTISSTTTQTLTTCNGTTTNFAFANKIFGASDLVATLIDTSGNLYSFTSSGVNTFTNATTGLSYTVYNIDVDAGCFIVFSSAPTNLWQLDLRTAIGELQSTSIKNQAAFYPELHEEFFDRITREVQDLRRLTYTYGIHGPDIESTAWTQLPSANTRANLLLGFDSNGLPTTATNVSQALTQSLIGQFLYPQTAAEIAAGVTPTNYAYPAFNVLRYMSTAQSALVLANSLTDVTTAVQSAINCITVGTYPVGGAEVFFPAGTYGISASLVIPITKFNFSLRGVAGFASVLQMMGSASFDMIAFANPGSGNLFFCLGVIQDLRLVGNGSATGSGNLLNTQYATALQIRNLLLLNIVPSGNGINVVGNPNGSVYSHDIQISNIYYESGTGNAVIYLGATSSDSIIEKVVGGGGFTMNYGIYVAAGAQHHKIANCHPYNHLLNALYMGTSAIGHWVSGSRFENCLADSAALVGAQNNTFTDCQFTYAPSGFSCLALNGAISNKFNNCAFIATPSVSSYAIKETNFSNNNCFNGFVTENAFAVNPAFVLVGALSVIRQSGSDFILSGGPISVAAGSTTYFGNGAATENIEGTPCVFGGFATQLLIECDTAPGTSQSFTATLMINAVAQSMSATISGSGFSFQTTNVAYIAPGASICVRVVASGGAATAFVRTCLVVNQ